MQYFTTLGGREFQIEIVDEHHVQVDGRLLTVDVQPLADDPSLMALLMDGRAYEAEVAAADGGWEVRLAGRRCLVQVEEARQRRLRLAVGEAVRPTGDLHLTAPMPGLVLAVLVGEGQAVQAGDVLVLLESMKMQNEIRAPRAGTVTRLQVRSGDRVEARQPLLTLA